MEKTKVVEMVRIGNSSESVVVSERDTKWKGEGERKTKEANKSGA
jgi:hypothetical protein